MAARKRIAVLGSTGSIGRGVLSVVEAHPDAFEVVGLSAFSSLELLAEQADRFSVRRLAVADERCDASSLPPGVEVGVGERALVALAADPGVDLVVNALVGTAGLPVTAAAVRAGRRLAIANKESLVMAGELVTTLARETGAELIPVDSEHSSIFRCLRGTPPAEVAGVVLTASGGPLRDASPGEAADAGVEAVLAHPTWDMGAKITVDSATLVNKAMEVVEAHWLFGLPYERIDVVLHRESLVHSLVLLSDGSMLAHLGTPDMRVPIQYALFYPDAPTGVFDECRPAGMGTFTFEPVDMERYPSFELVLDAARSGGTSATTAATADEVAVDAFLDGTIRFGDIAAVIGATLESEGRRPAGDIEAVLEAGRSARSTAEGVVAGLAASVARAENGSNGQGGARR